MRDQPPADVLGSLPHSRLARRSDKRPPRPQPAQPQGAPGARGGPSAALPVPGVEIIGTAVKAAAELAEIALWSGSRALRRAISNLPRP